MKPAEQLDALKAFVPGVDFDEIAGLEAIQRPYDDRRTDLAALETRIMPANSASFLIGGKLQRLG